LPIDLVIGREHTQRSQVVKQADVALIALLPEEFPGSMAEANFPIISCATLTAVRSARLKAVATHGAKGALLFELISCEQSSLHPADQISLARSSWQAPADRCRARARN
jgi:hypothetical protein